VKKTPLKSLDDRLVSYDLITRREPKIKPIKRCIVKSGVLKPEFLSGALEQRLPGKTRNLLMEMLAM